jgi:hypothetical protein
MKIGFAGKEKHRTFLLGEIHNRPMGGIYQRLPGEFIVTGYGGFVYMNMNIHQYNIMVFLWANYSCQAKTIPFSGWELCPPGFQIHLTAE